MSSAASPASASLPGPGPWPPRRPSKRSKLRNGTFIIPATGERARRAFTLRSSRSRANSQPDGSSSSSSDSSEIGNASIFSGQTVRDGAHSVAQKVKTGTRKLLGWMGSPAGHGVLKCTLAYTLASLFTFWTPLSDWLGKPDGKHVVATITVYFHPARTAGSMIEAILIAIVAVAYAQIVSLLSMSASVLIGSVWGMPGLAHAVVLIFFIGGGFGFIGWVKQRQNNPLVNVGSTLASLAIISVVTKETAVLTNVFSNQKLVQILKMLVMGITATTTVNLFVWRVSAVSLLRESMTKTSTSLGDLLAMVTSSFLTGSEDDLPSDEFNAASAAYTAGYAQLTKNLREAKFERYFLGWERVYKLDRAVVRSMETLAQSVGGLRSAANTQFALLKESAMESGSLRFNSPEFRPISPTLQRSLSSILKSGKDRSLVLSAIEERSEESSPEDDPDMLHPANKYRRRSDGGASFGGASAKSAGSMFKNSSEIFELFIALLGPSMKSLAYTLAEILRDPPFGSAPDYDITINEHYRQSLSDALSLFNTARANALQELYNHLELDRTRSEKIQADFEEVAAACGHFSFSLQTFGEEMQKYLDVLDDLKHASDQTKRSWHWLVWWRKDHPDRRDRILATLPYDNDEEREGLLSEVTRPAQPEPVIKPIKKTALPRGVPEVIVKRRDTFNWEAAQGQSSRLVAAASQKLLRFARRVARDEIRFGVKVGIGATLWAMFAFLPQTRDIYQHWRGEWGLLSFMIVCSMTVGASNTTGWSRLMGTVIGASASFVNWNLTNGNALALICLDWFVAFWSYWMIVARGQAPLGRITLLAYNVSTLYAYSLSQKVDDDDDDEGGIDPIISEIIKHRFVAVTVGILWGLLVCRVVWPISARKKFKQGISTLYLQMGLIWKRGPLAILLRSDCSRSYLKSGEQAALQKYAARLDALRVAAASEFELRGPFPTKQSAALMRCTHRLLDAFYAMSLVTQQRTGRLTEGERALLLFTAEERKVLCDRICHVFQVLASSMMLEYPLTDALPSVLGMRDRLLGKIFQFRKEHVPGHKEIGALDDLATTVGNGNGTGKKDGGSHPHYPGRFAHVNVEERDYALLYAYALVTGQVAEELGVVAKEIESLFGVLDEGSLLLQ